jgi:uncharacterized protein involved in exopolysaccharide biosynthesis
MSDESPIRSRNQQIPAMRELVMVLFRRRRVFACVAGIVLIGAVIHAMTGVKYQSNMKILVRRGRAEAPVSAAVNAPLDLTRTGITEEDLNSEVELLRDSEVLRDVVEDTGAGGRDWFHVLHTRDGRAQRVERAARRLAQRVNVQPIKRTNLIAISYQAGDPESAAKVLRSLADIYMRKHMAVHRPEGELAFFEQQTEESRLRLEESSHRLLVFTKSHAVVAAALQRDLALQKLSELEAGERQTRIDIAQSRQRTTELEERLGALPERATTQVRTADNAELLKAVKTTLLDLELRRIQLLTKFEPTHRLVQELNQQIAQMEAAIMTENSSPVRDQTTDKNANYEWATGELLRTQVELKALEAREVASAAQQSASRHLAAKLGEDAVIQDRLLSTQKTAQENYLLYVKKTEEARMNDALDKRGIVNVAIAEQPVAPALPVSSVWTMLALGWLGAGVAGVGSAFAAEYLDPAFRDPDDVLTYLNTPVLASLPRRQREKLSA